MVDQNLLRVDGCVVFWSLGEWSRRETLKECLKDLGFEKFCPEPRTQSAALKDALGTIFPKRKYLVQPLSRREAWEIREIVRGDQENEYPAKHTAALRETGTAPEIVVSPFDQMVADELVRVFNEYLGLVRTAQVTAAMTGVLAHLGGTSLRPRGAVYWLPGHQIKRWQAVTSAVESSGVGNSNRTYVIRHNLDADAFRAVRHAIVAEVHTEVARIETDINSGDLGERALDHRKDEAVELRDKIRLYESLLNTTLEELVVAVDQVEGAAVQAALMAQAGAELV